MNTHRRCKANRIALIALQFNLLLFCDAIAFDGSGDDFNDVSTVTTFNNKLDTTVSKRETTVNIIDEDSYKTLKTENGKFTDTTSDYTRTTKKPFNPILSTQSFINSNDNDNDYSKNSNRFS